MRNIIKLLLVIFLICLVRCNSQPTYNETSKEYWTWKLHHISDTEGNDNPMIRHEIVEKLLKLGAILPSNTNQKEVKKILGNPDIERYVWSYDVSAGIMFELFFKKGHNSKLQEWNRGKAEEKAIKCGLPVNKLIVGMSQSEIKKLLGKPLIVWAWTYTLSSASSLKIGFDENGIVTNYKIDWEGHD